VYSASNGGVWLITRSLENKWLGQAAQQDLAGEVTSIVADGHNRILVSDGTYINQYDTVLGGWGKWQPQTPALLVSAYQGEPVYINSGLAWKMTPGTWVDFVTHISLTLPVIMTVNLSPVHLGGKRNIKVVWNVQAQGQVFNPCFVSAVMYYDDYAQSSTVYGPVALSTGQLAQDFPPVQKRSTSIGLSISNAYTDGTVTYSPGRAFSLELLSFYVGTQKGTKKLPTRQRSPGMP